VLDTVVFYRHRRWCSRFLSINERVRIREQIVWRVAELQTRHVMTLYKASATTEQQARSTYQYLGLYDDSERARMASTASLQGGGGQCSKRASPGEGEMQARIPVILQSLDGLRPVDLRLLHNELDVILTHICIRG
jgi:hypothetical protein